MADSGGDGEAITLAEYTRGRHSNNGTFPSCSSSSESEGHNKVTARPSSSSAPPEPDEDARSPPTTQQLTLGLCLGVIFSTALALAGPSLRLLGAPPEGELPTLELVIVSYGAQALLLLPAVACQWRHCRDAPRRQVGWLLGAGSMAALALLWIFQAAVTLGAEVVSALGLACLVIFTLLTAVVMKVPVSRALLALYVLALVGLALLLAAALQDASKLQQQQQEENTRQTRGLPVPRDAPVNVTTAAPTPTTPPVTPGEPIYAYCALVVSGLLLAAACLTVHRRCHRLHTPSFLFWLALVGTAVALLQMTLFAALWPAALVPPPALLPCAVFLGLHALATTTLHIAWRHVPPPVFPLVCGPGVLLYALLGRLLPALQPPSPAASSPALALAGGVILLLVCLAGPAWALYASRTPPEPVTPT